MQKFRRLCRLKSLERRELMSTVPWESGVEAPPEEPTAVIGPAFPGEAVTETQTLTAKQSQDPELAAARNLAFSAITTGSLTGFTPRASLDVAKNDGTFTGQWGRPLFIPDSEIFDNDYNPHRTPMKLVSTTITSSAGGTVTKVPGG